MISTPVPGGNGKINGIGFDGKFWAAIGAAHSEANSIITTANPVAVTRRMSLSMALPPAAIDFIVTESCGMHFCANSNPLNSSAPRLRLQQQPRKMPAGEFLSVLQRQPVLA